MSFSLRLVKVASPASAKLRQSVHPEPLCGNVHCNQQAVMHACDKAVCPVCTVKLASIVGAIVFQKLMMLTVCLDQDLAGDATAYQLQS